MNKKLAAIWIVLFSQTVRGNVLYYGSEPESINLVFGESTIVRFDEEVKTISQASNFEIEPANPQDPDYRVLTIKPRENKGSSSVTFILANDVVINTKISVVTSNLLKKRDSFYDFKAKSLQVDPTAQAGIGSSVSEIELMKAMIRADKVIGYTDQAMSDKINTGIEGVAAQLVKVYTGPKYHGYIFKVTNTSKSKTYALDVKSLTLGRPNVALLSQADENVLYPAPHEQTATLLRIVAKPTAVYHSVTLPIAPILEK